MAGRTPREAVANFLEPLKAVVSCITSEGFVTRYSQRSGEQQTADFQDGFTILERENGHTLTLELAHRYTVVEAEGERGPWAVQTAEYIYDVADEADREIVSFHWHPLSAQLGDEMRSPHLHVYGAHESPTLTLHRLHLPTGRISIEAVVRFLIEDLKVIPRRDDWRDVLDRHEEQFRRLRSWA